MPPRRWAAVRIAAVGLVAALGLQFAVPAAADQLDDRKQELAGEMQTADTAMGESSKELQDAMARLETSQQELTTAEETLARTRGQVAAAQAEDARLAASLEAAQAELADAIAAVEAGERAVADQRAMIGDIAREQYQQQHNLMGMAVLVQQGSSAGLQTRIQLSTTLMDSNQAQLDRLNEMLETLEAAREAKAQAEARVSAEKDAAAQVLASLQQLESAEAEQKAALDAAVSANTSAQQEAQKQVAADEEAYEQLSSERDQVNAEIAARDEANRQAAEAKAEADRLAREAAAAQASADAAAAAKESESESSSEPESSSEVKATAGEKSDTSEATVSNKESSYGLIYPVDGPVTSQYGMRKHPITGVYKLHDGIDFGAGCGVPIRAVADGKVTERYYNAGYGNRLFLEHGTLSGKRTTTSYNHLSGYNVSVGEWVSQGDVIGYVGTTGYSTGCHLHFMVWRNGTLVNPAHVL